MVYEIVDKKSVFFCKKKYKSYKYVRLHRQLDTLEYIAGGLQPSKFTSVALLPAAMFRAFVIMRSKCKTQRCLMTS